jgi:hypothetical protein
MASDIGLDVEPPNGIRTGPNLRNSTPLPGIRFRLNTDEEAANLVLYQQYYDACAKPSPFSRNAGTGGHVSTQEEPNASHPKIW